MFLFGNGRSAMVQAATAVKQEYKAMLTQKNRIRGGLAMAVTFGIGACALLGACSGTVETGQPLAQVAARDAYADGCAIGQADGQ